MNMQKNVLLGGFLVVCIAVITVLTLYVRGMSLKDRVAWTVYFGQDSLVEEGFEVWSAGMRVGVVDRVEPVPQAEYTATRQVRATILVDREMVVWRDGELVVRSRGLLGGFRAELVRGTPAAGVRPHTEPLPGRVDRGIADQLSEMVRENRANLNEITRNLADATGVIRRGEGSIGALVHDKQLRQDLRGTVRNLRKFTDTLNDPDSLVGRALRDKELYEQLKRGIQSVADISEKINRGQGTLGRLVNEDALLKEFQRGLKTLADLAADLRGGEGTFGLLLRDRETADNVAATLRSLRRFTDALNSGEGTIPQLLNRPTIYNDLAVFSANLRAISEDISSGKGTLGKLLGDDEVYNSLRSMLDSFRESGDIARENAAMGSLVSFSSLFFNVLN